MMIRAQLELAEIYLNIIGNEKEYIKCHQRILEKGKTIENIILLGDAYMAIRSPSEAASAYEQAVVKDPESEVITMRLGKALEVAGEDERVIEVYENNLRNHPCHHSVRVELIALYKKLSMHDKATNLLNKAIKENDTHLSTSEYYLSTRLSLLTMLAEIHESNDEIDGMFTVLLEAKYICRNIIEDKKNGSGFELGGEQDPRKALSGIFSKLARCAEDKGDLLGAVNLMKESLDIQSNEEVTMIGLGRLLLKQENYDECKDISEKLMATAPESESVLQLRADLMIAVVNFAEAIEIFKRLLSLFPSNYDALSRFICILHREGKEEEINDLVMAFDSKSEGDPHPGLLYAKVCVFLLHATVA